MGSTSINQQPTLLHTILGSALSGLGSRAICHPVDTVKSRLQGADGYRYRGTLHCFQQTFATEGILGFYRGFGAVAVLGTPAVCIYLSTYEVFKSALGADGSELAFFGHFAAGMGAESASCLLFVPVDVVKERLQVQRAEVVKEVQSSSSAKSSAPPSYSGSLHALKVICRTEGLSGIYKGYFATLASFGPMSALYFGFYEQFRKAAACASGAPDKASLSASGTMMASAAAGSLSAALTSPLDMAKLRLQTQRRLAPGEPVPEGHLSGFPAAFRAIYSEGGVRALFRGVGARVAFHTPSTCITMTVFEECRRLIQKII